jgi:hypothetical protein
MLWDNDLIYMSTKKAYVILNKRDGGIVQMISIENQPIPMLCLAKGKPLVINKGNQGFFVDTKTGMKNNIVFKFEKYPTQYPGDKG